MSHKPTTREEHPLPAVLMHWGNVVSMAALIFTGFYIHSPFFPGFMNEARSLHFLFMFVLIYAAVIRVYWAFFGRGSAAPGERVKRADYKFFWPEKKNKGKFIPVIKYYLFLQKTHPATSKYNTLQKGTYAFWLLLIAAQAVTGFALWAPTAEFLQTLTYAVGGTTVMRLAHYSIMWVFILTVSVHVYLSVAEGIRQLPLMFFWRETASKETAKIMAKAK